MSAEAERLRGAPRPHELLLDALPGLVAVAVFLVWARLSGGFFPHVWYAGGIFLAGLLVAVLLAVPGLTVGLRRSTLIALAALAGFTAWSYAAISWAAVPGSAWDGASRTAVYLLVFALFALWRWTPAGVLAVLGAFSLGVAALGAWSLAAAARSESAAAFFHDGRFTHPVGYANGEAGLLLLALSPALVVASRREAGVVVRAAALATAAVLAQLALLPQSRGAAVAAVAAALVALLVLPDRLRVAVALVPVAVAAVVAAPELLAVADAAEDPGELARRSEEALRLIALTSAGVLVAGVALGLLDRTVRLPARATVWLGRAALAGALLAVAVGVPLAAGDPRDRARAAWDDLTGDPPTSFEGRVGFERGFETNRVDLWRVAVREFRDHPVAGIGPDNFAVPYLLHRRTEEETLFPHSFPVQVLSQTGLVGSVLMGTFLLAALWAGARARVRADGLAAAASGAALVTVAYWLVHASVDWFWELPALTAPALAALALAAAPRRAPQAPAAAGRTDRLVPLALAGAAALVAVSFVPPWLAAREVRYAVGAWRAEPAAADAALERARRLNPLSERADLAAAVIARYRGDWDGMARSAGRALERSPENWYAHLQLGLARARQGRPEEASAAVERSLELNPSEPLLGEVRARLESGEEVDLDELARVFRERWELRAG